jgi:hypothetical protein
MIGLEGWIREVTFDEPRLYGGHLARGVSRTKSEMEIIRLGFLPNILEPFSPNWHSSRSFKLDAVMPWKEKSIHTLIDLCLLTTDHATILSAMLD